jgi:hypothetical protein
MKITKTQLKQIIKEELEMVKEDQSMIWVDRYVESIEAHLRSNHVPEWGKVMEMVNVLARNVKGE